MMGFAGRAAGYMMRRSLPYAFVFVLGAVAGSGVLSKQENQDYIHQQQIEVSDDQGKQYVVDLEKKFIRETTADDHKKRADLVELLK